MACQAPPRPLSSVTVPVGGDANKKGALSHPDVHMNDAEAEAMLTSLHLKLRPPPSTPPTWPLTCNPSLSMLGCTALSATPSGIAPNPRLIQLALAKPLEGIQATILSVKAKDDHAQQISPSALKMVPAAAAAAASATRTYTPTAAVTLKPPPSPTAQIPRTKASAPPATPTAAPTRDRSN